MELQTKHLITKDTTIGDVVQKYPEVVETLESFGVHCVGCHVSPFESIEMGFKGHGMSDEQIHDAVKKINEVIEKNDDKVEEPKQEEFDFSKATMTVTDKAANKIKELIKQENKKGLRISVLPGGCSGSKYGMELDDEIKEDDIIIEEKGIKIFIDKESIMKLNGCNVDFIDSLQGAGFKIGNPNATTTCGCGDSFG